MSESPHAAGSLVDWLALARSPQSLAAFVAARPARSPSLDALAAIAPRLHHASDPARSEDLGDDPDGFDGHGVFDDFDDLDAAPDDADASFWQAVLAEAAR